MSNLDREIYKLLNSRFKNPPKVESNPARPTKKDYDKGYVSRYFARQSNDEKSQVIEINTKTYQKLRGDESGFYMVAKVDWRITGQLTTKIIDGIKYIGVQEANNNSIIEAEKKISNISVVFGSLIQFHKPSTGQNTKGFGDDLGYDDFEPDSGGSTNPGGNTSTSGGGGTY